MNSDKPKGKCGFAAMDPDKQREIASKGGRSAQAEGGNGHRFNHEQATETGRKGGLKILRERGPEYFREMGRKGGRKRIENLRVLQPKPDSPEKAR